MQFWDFDFYYTSCFFVGKKCCCRIKNPHFSIPHYPVPTVISCSWMSCKDDRLLKYMFLGQISCSFLKTFFNKNNFVVLVLLKELNVKIYLTEYINTEIRKFEIRNWVKTNQRYLQGSWLVAIWSTCAIGINMRQLMAYFPVEFVKW